MPTALMARIIIGIKVKHTSKDLTKLLKANSAWWCLLYMKTHQLKTGFEAQGSNIGTKVRIHNIQQPA